MITSDTGGHAIDFAIGHAFRFFHGLFDGLSGGINIGYHTGAQAARGSLP